MSMPSTVETLLTLGAATHVRASTLSRSDGWFAGWHERRFGRAIRAFIRALESLPQSEAERTTVAQRSDLGTLINAIVSDIERFIERHNAGSLKRVERNRYLVNDIYHLRASFEALARGVTADPQYEDVRWEMKIDPSRTGPDETQPR
jgi:thiaminase